MSARRRRWLIAGGVLIAAAAVAIGVDGESAVAGTLGLFAVLWVVGSLGLLLRRVWRWMTYRVGVRLLISYLLVGVTPFVFAAAFAAVGLWILMGQYTSVRFGSEIRRVRSQLVWEGAAVLERARTTGPEAAASLLEELATRNPQPLEDVIWQARIGGLDVRLGGEADLPELDWVGGDQRDIVARYGNRMFGVVAATSTNGDRVTALIPFDSTTALAISKAWWFDVALLSENEGGNADEGDVGIGDEVSASAEPDGDIKISVEGRTFAGGELWPPWTETDDRLLSKPSVIWFRVTPDIVDLETGSKIEGASLLALLRTSPRAVWDDFTLSRYELGSNILTPLAALGSFFVIVYGLAAAVAAMMILSITRSVRRLSVGAREVERGNLGHRVPVKRRDQLGDLARSFNHMTGSVQSMVSDVAEKERLARELELAREIQESLLPANHLVVGPLVVRATFQPAAEVGGDYFDVFSIAGDRLVVAIGDVAGHGLSTGLLMAGLKSSVAALVHEGYSGADLIDRVNGLLMGSGRARTLVTLTVVEIDAAAGRLRLANAGHPPAFLIDSRSGPREVMMGSVPMGSPLCRAVELARDFAEGHRLLLYSDGLVEAQSPDGEPFGYDRLERVLAASTRLDGDALTSAVLGALGEHTGATPHADDLTLLVIERVP